MIGIIDYGKDNIASVRNSLRHLGVKSVAVHSKEDLDLVDTLILPGTATFDEAMKALSRKAMDLALKEKLDKGTPLLAIGLGMHLLFEESEEGSLEGLGILEGKVRPFHFIDSSKRGLKVPHSGWNALEVHDDDPLYANGSEVYFNHMHYALPKDPSIIVASTDYGGSFTSAIRKDRIEGMQFHPEKSGAVGLQILRRFLNRSINSK